MSAVQERKYAMTRVRAGDYLLPSNDGKTLWRIASYHEDGSAEWQDERGQWHKVVGTFWQTAKYRHGVPRVGLLDEDFLDWNEWHTWETNLRTRKEAVEAALRS